MSAAAVSEERVHAVGERIERGFGLPGDWYTDPAIFALEQEKIFRGRWQFAGHTTQVKNSGDFFTCEIAGVPLIITRDSDGSLRAWENVCRHRGSEIVRGAGNRSSFSCPFHGWTYGLDGRLLGVPRSREVCGFDKAEYPLLAAKAEQWGPFIFANTDADAAPLATFLAEVPSVVTEVGLDIRRASKPPIRRFWDINANWKACVENFCECYHCQLNHPGFTEVLNLTPRELITREYDSLCLLLLKDDSPTVDGEGNGRHALPSFSLEGALFDALIWPNFVFNTYPGPGNITTQLIVPVTVDRTLMIYDYFMFDEAEDEETTEFVEFWDQVQHEDMPLVEGIQRGVKSGSFRGGPLLPADGLVRHFNQWLCRELVA